jgi:hypothetical protein
LHRFAMILGQNCFFLIFMAFFGFFVLPDESRKKEKLRLL